MMYDVLLCMRFIAKAGESIKVDQDFNGPFLNSTVGVFREMMGDSKSCIGLRTANRHFYFWTSHQPYARGCLKSQD